MLQKAQAIALIYRDAFSLNSPVFEPWTGKASLSEIVRSVNWLPENFSEVGTISINSHIISRENWSKIYPHARKNGEPVDVVFQVAMQGGKKGGKQIFAFVAALALTFVTAGISGGSLVKLLGSKFAAGTMGAKLAAAGVSLVGGLVVNALTSAPVNGAMNDEGGGVNLNPASVRGNVLRANAPIPTVIGTRKIFPPFLSEPIVEMIEQNEVVTATFGLAGPHKLENIRVGDALASEVSTDLTVQTYDGLPNSVKPILPQRYGKTFAISTEMSTHGTRSENGADYIGPNPVWHSFSTADAPDETWLHIYLAGLFKDDIATEKLRIPFRIRMRKRGDTVWRNLPELHYMENTQAQRRLQIKFMFGQDFTGSLPTISNGRGWIEARKSVPLPGGGTWDADAYFSVGAGDDVYNSATATTTKVKNIIPIENTLFIYLDSASFLPGVYDVQIIRGATFRNDLFVSSTYVYSGAVTDFYETPLNNVMCLSRTGMLDKVNLVRCVNVKNQSPLNEKNLSLIHLTAVNRDVDQVSVTASGYVHDYVPGSGWSNLITTSNPAPHFRNLLTGSLNADPLPSKMLWDASLIEWRQHCIDNDLTCDLIVEGGSVFDTMRIVASCGYASPYQSEIWGVIIDKYRGDEPPEQTFTPRNSNEFSIRKSFSRMASGLRPNFKDENYEYSGKQILVYADEVNKSDALTEQIEYVGIVNRDKIIRRAKIDLKQARERSTVYSFKTNVASLAIRRGSLIAVSNDVIMRYQSQSARIKEVLINSSDFITGFILDSEITVNNEGSLYTFADVYDVFDIFLTGIRTGVAIRNSLGMLTTHSISSATVETSQVSLVNPIEIDVELYKTGNLVLFGNVGNEYRRLIVSSIQYNERKHATINAVDEAATMWDVFYYLISGFSDLSGSWSDGEYW